MANKVTLEKFIQQAMRHVYCDDRSDTIEIPKGNFEWAINTISHLQDKIATYEQGLDEIAKEGIGYGKIIAEKTLEVYE